jgi:Cu(I)/Ag(I) efflux system membrane fusion protein
MTTDMETRATRPREHADASPFGALGATPRARRMRALALAGLVGVAAVGTWFLTRDRTAPTSEGGHAGHGAAPASSAARPVTLSAEDARRIGVTYATATTGPLELEVRTVAQVAYDERRVEAIAPKLDGWVEELYVNATGQPVRRGDPLLAIYSPMLVSAQQELLVASRLRGDVSGASAATRDDAEALRAAARRRLLYWDISPSDIERIERTGEVQKTLVLRSPASGIVLEKNVVKGQRIMAGDGLYRVADLSVVWLEGEVFERDLARVKLGQAVAAEFEALPGQTRLGRIAYIYPTLNAETRTGRVRVELPNPGLALKPGMYGTIRVRGVGPTMTVLVPRSAVLRTGKRDLVFIRSADGMLSPREVTLGAASADQVQVLRGLNAGETVVASATFLVDAESNLGSAAGGMGDMPGMDIGDVPETTPTAPRSSAPPAGGSAPSAPGGAPRTPGGQDMPGMSHE